MILFSPFISKTFVSSKCAPFYFPKRFFPGNNQVGHALKVFNAVNNRSLISLHTLNIWRASYKKLLSDFNLNKSSTPILLSSNSPTPTIPQKSPLLFAETEHLLETNYPAQKYLKVFSSQGLLLPYPIINFPTDGISGSYTISKEYGKLLSMEYKLKLEFAYSVVRYVTTMYAGSSITSWDDITLRTKQLFTKDPYIHQYAWKVHIHGIENLNPLLQHWFSLDTWNLLIPRDSIKYPSNFNVPLKYVSCQKHLEIEILQHSHKHLVNSKDEILVIDLNNTEHKNILTHYATIVKIIAKQPNVDNIVTSITGLNKKVIYPIDVKIYAYPENNLKVLSCHSSISPDLQLLKFIERLQGQLTNQIKKLTEHSSEKMFFSKHLNDLNTIIKLCKKQTNLTNSYKELLQTWLIEFHKSQILSGKIIYDGMSFLPSIIADAYTSENDNNYFEYLQNNNVEELNRIIKEIANETDFLKYFPQFEQYKKYQPYETQLFIMTICKKFHCLENYYTLRKLSLIPDIHNVI